MQGLSRCRLLAAVNGLPFGAALILANMADCPYKRQRKPSSAKLFLNLESFRGTVAPALMQRLIGYPRAFELTLSGRIVDAHEAKRMGHCFGRGAGRELMHLRSLTFSRTDGQPAALKRLANDQRLMKDGAAGWELARTFWIFAPAFKGMCHTSPEHWMRVNRDAGIHGTAAKPLSEVEWAG